MKVRVSILVFAVAILFIGLSVAVYPTYKEHKVSEYMSLADTAITQDNLLQAAEYYKAVISYDRNNLLAYAQLSDIYQESGDTESAMAYADMQIAAMSEKPYGYLHKAKVYEARGELERAFEYSAKAQEFMHNVSVTPLEEFVFPVVYTGDILMKAGKAIEARRSYLSALAMLIVMDRFAGDQQFFADLKMKYMDAGGSEEELAFEVEQARSPSTVTVN